MAETPNKPTSKKSTAKKTTTDKKDTTKVSVDKNNDTVSSTKKVGGGTKAHPVSAERLKAAEDVIKQKAVKSKSQLSKATIDLKKRAAEAKHRAQQKILDKGYVSDPVDPLERLANTFDTSAKRWEMVVYPSLFAFILLAGYGFFLIYHLTRDISMLAHNITAMTNVVVQTMPKMAKDLGGMTGSINSMTGDINSMSENVTGMRKGISKMSDQMTTLRPMNANLANMTDTMNSMNRSVYGMHRDMGNMNKTISSGPFGVMNDMMPFSSNSYQGSSLPPPRYYPPTIAPPSSSSAKPMLNSVADAIVVNKR